MMSFVVTLAISFLTGFVMFALFAGARALVAVLARVPGQLSPFGEAPRAAWARRSLLTRLALTFAGPLAVYGLATALAAMQVMQTGVISDATTLINVVPGGAADAAGMQDGDRIEAIDGEPLTRFTDIRRVVAASAGKSLDVLVERQGRRLHVSVTPSAGKIGVQQRPEQPTLAAAIRAALPMPFQVLPARLDEARKPVADLAGPLAITGPPVRASLGASLLRAAAGVAVASVDGLLLIALFLFPFRRRSEPAEAVESVGFAHPWRRAAARAVDVAVFATVFIVILMVINQAALVEALGASLLFPMIPLEAALLASWGTTPGKALLGISVRDGNGGKLPFGVALRRTAGAWMFGLAANLPIGLLTGLFALARRVAYWDAVDGHRVEHRAVSGLRVAIVAAVVGLLLLYGLGIALKPILRPL